MLETFAVITAGGTGQRMGSQVPKQFLALHNKPLILHTLQAFQDCSDIHAIVLTLPPHMFSEWPLQRFHQYGISKLFAVVPGDKTRQLSVYQGLKALPASARFVAIHDGARCLITPQAIAHTLDALKIGDVEGMILATPVKDTLKEVHSGRIVKTLDRSQLWAMQTPQVFRFPRILEAHRRIADQGHQDATDDAAVLELDGGQVRVHESLEFNLKVTYPQDIALAEVILADRETKKEEQLRGH